MLYMVSATFDSVTNEISQIEAGTCICLAIEMKAFEQCFSMLLFVCVCPLVSVDKICQMKADVCETSCNRLRKHSDESHGTLPSCINVFGPITVCIARIGGSNSKSRFAFSSAFLRFCLVSCFENLRSLSFY